MEARLHRADGNVFAGGDLVEREPVQMVEEDDAPVCIGEVAQGLVEVAGGGHHRHVVVERDLAANLPTAPAIHEVSVRDGCDPRADGRSFTIEGGQGTKDTLPHLLIRVLGVVRHPPTERPEPRPLSRYEHALGVRIAPSGARDDGIHARENTRGADERSRKEDVTLVESDTYLHAAAAITALPKRGSTIPLKLKLYRADRAPRSCRSRARSERTVR